MGRIARTGGGAAFVLLTLGAHTAAHATPDQTRHRTSPGFVPWEMNESAYDGAVFSLALPTDMPPVDFEFNTTIEYYQGGSYVDIEQYEYMSTDVERASTYDIPGMKRFGPGPAPTVISAMQTQGYRPIDIEYNYLDAPAMMAVAVPNTGDNFAYWFVGLDYTEQQVQNIRNIQFPIYRPVDIEYAGENTSGADTYAVLAVQNFGTLGNSDWWVRFNMNPSSLMSNQQSLGRILDLEPRNGQQYDDPRWDAIFIPWSESRPVYNHVIILASPSYDGDWYNLPDRINRYASETNFFDAPFDLPGLTAGYRITDIEYFWYRFGSTLKTGVDGTFVDAPSGLQKRVRDALDAISANPMVNGVQNGGFQLQEVGHEALDGIHRQTTLFSSPHEMPFIAAYAVLNDDLDLTEQQLYTCNPFVCPPPTGICSPQLFTIRELAERMMELQDTSAAQTLISERYEAVHVNAFILNEIIDPTNCVACGSLSEYTSQPGRFCGASVRLEDLTALVTKMTDGTLGDPQTSLDFLDIAFDPAGTSLRASIEAVIDDEAAETDIGPTSLQAYKDAMQVLSRTFRHDASIFTNAWVDGHRVTHLAFATMPMYDNTLGSVTFREFSVNATVETLTNDTGVLDGVIAEGLRDAIADGLASWEDYPEGCNDADIAEPYGTLNVDDVLAFLGGFAGGDPIADLAPPAGTFNVDDVLTFLGAFAGGCP